MSRSILVKPAVLAMCLLVARSAPAFGQEIGSKEWLEKTLAICQELEFPDDTYFEFIYTTHAGGTPDDLDRLETEGGNNPHSSKFQQYQELSRRLKNGPDVSRYRVWYFDQAHWRVSVDQPFAPKDKWFDAALDRDNSWRMSTRSLILLNTRNPTPGYDILGHLDMPLIVWKALGASGIGSLSSWSVLRTQTDGNKWTARLGYAGNARELELRGNIDPNGLLRVYESLIVRSDDAPRWLHTRTTFLPDTDGVMPRLIESIEPAIGKTVEYPSGENAPFSWEVVAVRAIDPVNESRSNLLRTPTIDKGDAVRSLAKITGIVDKRANVATPVVDGELRPDSAVALPDPAQSANKSALLQYVVATVIGIILVALLFIRQTQK